MANPERVVLIDGSWLIFRAYFAIPSNLRTSSGLPTNAIYGFATMFRKLLAGRTPERGAVVFDAPGATFRDEKFPDYKADRPAMADDLVVQLPWIDRLVQAHRFPLLRVPGYEADDVIGTLARLAQRAGMEVYIVSGDKDFAQLVGDGIRMVDTMRDVTYDPDLVFKKWGARPGQMIDLLALAGDKVDNIPGVPGIGQKTAVGLLERYGSLDGVLAHVGELKGKQRENLAAFAEQARLSRELATIDTCAPVGVTLEDLVLGVPEAPAVNGLLTELEFYSLLSRDAAQASEVHPDASYRICRSLDDVHAALTELPDHLEVALCPVFEREDAPPEFDGLAGLAFGTGPLTGFYVPLRAADGGLGEPGLNALRDWLGRADAPKLAHNAKVLWRELRRRGVALNGVVGDTMLASFLVDPTKLIPHLLDKVAREFLQRVPRASKSVVGSGHAQLLFGDVPAQSAGDLGCHLAATIWEAWPLVARRLDEVGLRGHLLEHELPLSWVLGQMELDGVRVDKADLVVISEELRTRLAAVEQTIYALAGHSFNINSTRVLATVLFEELGLPVIKKTKTGYSTDAEVLERLARDHEIARRLLEQRGLAKLISTYTDVLQRAVNPSTGRVHATFQQTVGATGRIISTDPDLQRTPVRTEEGRRIRRAFVAEEGCVLISADWSQIELRLLAHFSGDAHLLEAFAQNRDVHRHTASELFGVPEDAVSREQRQVGKTVNFATIYGQGATALAQILGVPRPEAKDYIERYFATYTEVRRWLDETVAAASECGYVTTLLGRRRYIPELSSRNPMDRQAGERIAANTPIQGSAADVCKLVMLALPSRLKEASPGARLLMQIHDELVFEVPRSEVDAACRVVREVMEHPCPLRVPLVVDVGIGASWDEAH